VSSGPSSIAAAAESTPPDAFIEEVRCALAHLYDFAYLQNLPLSHRLQGYAPADGVTRAQRVRRLLLDSIERLRPEQPLAGEATRAYAILTYRCIDSLSVPEIADKLALSRRQAYREYARGVEAVASLIWDETHHDAYLAEDAQASPPTGEGTRLSAAQAEVERLVENLQLEVLALPEIVHNVATLVTPRVEQVGTTLHVSVAPLTILADRALLRQALLTLLSYALDVAGNGGRVAIDAARLANQVQLQVAATAAAPEMTCTSKRQGIGRAVALQLVEAMGGHAEVTQTQGHWCATLHLRAGESNSVLVIDDNTELAALFQRYMAGHNLTLTSATSAAQAIDLAGELKPQLIMLDLMLPHVDGWEILQRLRGMPALDKTPIVICSVLNEPDLALAMGANDYVTKPISQATLVDVLQRWLGTLHPAV
jgi:CheY-like chemotaxis protein